MQCKKYIRPWPIQKETALDGQGPFSLTVLPAGHPPGLYEMKRMFSRHVAALSGSVIIQSTWHDPTGGSQALISPSLGLNAAGPLGLASNVLMNSDGIEPLVFSGVFTGVTGAPFFEAHGTLYFIG